MDQAEKLRILAANLKNSGYVNKRAKVITVTSGKGGVGKTYITVNLAIALKQMGYEVVILDADLGLANVEIMLGMVLKRNLSDLLYRGISIQDIIYSGPLNVKVISGGSGIDELLNMNRNYLDIIVRKLSELDSIADFILIDTGAGISEGVQRFILAADEVIVVTLPEPTAIADAYALIKVIINKRKEKIFKLLINKAKNEIEAEATYNKINIAASKFLGINIYKLGYIPEDSRIHDAINRQIPYIIEYPHSYTTECIKKIASDIAGHSYKNRGIKGFFKYLLGY